MENDAVKKEWQEKYVKRLMERGLDEAFARQTLDAALDDIDYDDDPADAADTELSYWAD